MYLEGNSKAEWSNGCFGSKFILIPYRSRILRYGTAHSRGRNPKNGDHCLLKFDIAALLLISKQTIYSP